jgi:hypothetical protein
MWAILKQLLDELKIIIEESHIRQLPLTEDLSPRVKIKKLAATNPRKPHIDNRQSLQNNRGPEAEI